MQGGTAIQLPRPIPEIRIVDRIGYNKSHGVDYSFDFRISDSVDPLWTAILSRVYPSSPISISGLELQIICPEDQLKSTFESTKKAFEQTNAYYAQAIPMIKKLAEARDKDAVDRKTREQERDAQLRRTFEDLEI